MLFFCIFQLSEDKCEARMTEEGTVVPVLRPLLSSHLPSPARKTQTNSCLFCKCHIQCFVVDIVVINFFLLEIYVLIFCLLLDYFCGTLTNAGTVIILKFPVINRAGLELWTRQRKNAGLNYYYR